MIPLAKDVSEFGTVAVLESKVTGRLSYRQGGVFQSEADSDGISTASYIHAIFGLVRQARARKVLMIGCGGGTLGTMLARYGHRVTIVDVNPAAFRFARRYFHLPRSVECCLGDGLDHLARTRARYDAIVLDAYDGDLIPEHLRSEAFLAHVRQATRDNGLFLANIHTLDDEDRAADDFAEQIERIWDKVRLLDARGDVNRNTILVAGPQQKLAPPWLEYPPTIDAKLIADELGRMSFRGPRKD